MPDYLLGIDAGNTVAKAVLFDTTGRTVAMAQRDGGTQLPHPGYVERDLSELWRNTVDAVRSCIEQSGVDPKSILGIGVAGHGNGLYLIDGNGAPLIGVQSLDSRATGLTAELSSGGRDSALYDLCLQKPWPSQTATLLAWIKANRPDLYGATDKVLYCKDFVTYRLTGALASDHTDMGGGGLLTLPERDYSNELLALYGLEDAREKLPDLYASTDVVGRVNEEAAGQTGLAAGTPVVAGLFDIVASAIGAGTVETGEASVVAGSWSINQVVVDTPVRDEAVFMASTFDADRFLSIEASATSAVNLEWFAHQFMGGGEAKDGMASVYEHCSALAGSVEVAVNLPIYHPFIFGGSTHAHARGGFYGIEGWHTRAHMVYALFEGVVFGHMAHVQKLRNAGAAINAVRLSGGGSRSAVWSQMFADGLGKPVTVAGCEETGALGAALAAGVGAGVFRDLREAVTSMKQETRQYLPRPERTELFDGRHRLYLELCDAMATPWRRFGDLGT